jgi:HlyD family secretion protein
MKKIIITIIVLAAIAGSVGAYYKLRGPEEGPKVTTLPVSRGDVVEVVGASGTLQAVTTVQVGTQVSGIIKSLHNIDFNSIVKAGQVIAELDPSLIQTQIEQGKANLVRAQADLDRLKVSADDARNKLKRTQELAAKKLVAPQDLEAAEVAVRSADAQIKSSEASYVQAVASLNQTQVNLDHCIITAPIDGIVISRNVDVGQTVAASMSAPTIFIIAADLTKMQVNASVDESDVGRMRPGQVVRFRVDAFPGEEFFGTVAQVRLQPVTVQNVVTYATVINVPNPELKLKPGMTANVSIEIARKNDVLRVPNAALRFRPTADIFQALNLAVPPELQRGQGGQRGQGNANGQGGQRGGGTQSGGPGGANRGGQNAAPATSTPAPAAAPQASAQPQPRPAASAPATDQQGRRGGDQQAQSADRGNRGDAQSGQFGGGRGGGTPEERRQRLEQRMASMTPEERQAFQDRMARGRGGDPSAGGNRQGRGTTAAPGAPAATAGSRLAAVSPAANQTIDSLFGPLPVTETSGRAWLWVGGELKSVRLRLGITDGTYTELLSGELQAGQELVTQIVTPAAAQAAATRSPLMPGGPGQRGGMPGGGMPGGGQRGGGR